MVYQFTVVLATLDVMNFHMPESLYASVCDHGHPWSSEGVAQSPLTARLIVWNPRSVRPWRTCIKGNSPSSEWKSKRNRRS